MAASEALTAWAAARCGAAHLYKLRLELRVCPQAGACCAVLKQHAPHMLKSTQVDADRPSEQPRVLDASEAG